MFSLCFALCVAVLFWSTACGSDSSMSAAFAFLRRSDLSGLVQMCVMCICLIGDTDTRYRYSGITYNVYIYMYQYYIDTSRKKDPAPV